MRTTVATCLATASAHSCNATKPYQRHTDARRHTLTCEVEPQLDGRVPLRLCAAAVHDEDHPGVHDLRSQNDNDTWPVEYAHSHLLACTAVPLQCPSTTSAYICAVGQTRQRLPKVRTHGAGNDVVGRREPQQAQHHEACPPSRPRYRRVPHQLLLRPRHWHVVVERRRA